MTTPTQTRSLSIGPLRLRFSRSAEVGTRFQLAMVTRATDPQAREETGLAAEFKSDHLLHARAEVDKTLPTASAPDGTVVHGRRAHWGEDIVVDAAKLAAIAAYDARIEADRDRSSELAAAGYID
jgi:hypothetical protein